LVTPCGVPARLQCSFASAAADAFAARFRAARKKRGRPPLDLPHDLPEAQARLRLLAQALPAQVRAFDAPPSAAVGTRCSLPSPSCIPTTHFLKRTASRNFMLILRSRKRRSGANATSAAADP